MINSLKLINENNIINNQNNPQELKKYLLIKDILNQDDCFNNMPIEYAYSILKDLGIKDDELQKTYINLIEIKDE